MLLPLFLTACADSFTCVKISINSLSFLPSLLAFSAEIKDSTFAISASNSEAFCVISFVFTTTGFSVPSATVPVSLNPLSPFPGIACPFLGSWFLFTFSSVGLSTSLAVDFFILSNTNALFFKATVALSTSPWVATSLTSSACAVTNSTFASSITDAVFSETPALAIASWTRAIAALKLVLLAFAGVIVETSSLFAITLLLTVSVLVMVAEASLLANALPPPKNANPAAIKTDAVPTLNFLIP